jgi:hypothetical protein
MRPLRTPQAFDLAAFDGARLNVELQSALDRRAILKGGGLHDEWLPEYVHCDGDERQHQCRYAD